MADLKPCPICGNPPERFRAGRDAIDVIACRLGCKPNWNSVVVHITSRQVYGNGWADLADAWNTIACVTNAEGVRGIQFDRYPPNRRPIEPSGPSGPFNHWPRMVPAHG